MLKLNHLPRSQKLCLCMIVKNEAGVIARALDSVLPWIDIWCVLDTGSTDGTQEIIRKKLRHLNGHLFQGVDPQGKGVPDFSFEGAHYVGFADARNLARRLALTEHPDYLLLVDADETVEFHVTRPETLDKDGYLWVVDTGHDLVPRFGIIRADERWVYSGPCHEVLRWVTPDNAMPNCEIQRGIKINAINLDGARSREGLIVKFGNDAKTLCKWLMTHPDDMRSWYYYGRVCAAGGNHSAAITAFMRRIENPGLGDQQEVYHAAYSLGCIFEVAEEDLAEAEKWYRVAHDLRPGRKETIGHLARILRLQGRYADAMEMIANIIDLPDTGDALAVEPAWYRWAHREEYAHIHFAAGYPKKAANTLVDLLKSSSLPQTEMERINKNLQFLVKTIAEADNASSSTPGEVAHDEGSGVLAGAESSVL